MPHSVQLPDMLASGASRRSVCVTIDVSAIRSNLATARRCSGGSKQFATIKADAYGHGAVEVAKALSSADKSSDGNADGFAVVTVDEAIELREAGISLPILVLQGPQSADACVELRRHALWPVIHDLHQYEWYRRCAEKEQLHAWLKIDTGMGRLGVQPDEAETILNAEDGILWHGLLTHFACADETENPFTQEQIQRFKAIRHDSSLQRSLANSAGVLAWPDAKADWARPGIMLYGCNPLDRDLDPDVILKPAMTVTAPVIAVKLMAAGAGIGYAQTYQCPEDMPVGYVALGYRDGLPRVLDSSAVVSIDGSLCPIIGRVSMDSIAVDLRNAPATRPADVAEFWGENTSIDALAKAAGTINYELLTSIRGQLRYTGL